MEKSYGIEAARAQLGDIADHVRDTGQIIELTRHGRVVAVVGPTEAVKPVGSVEVTFLLPANHDDAARLPGVPRKGNIVRRESEGYEETWIVEQTEWYLSERGGGMLFAQLVPGDDYTRTVVARWETEQAAKG
jgi:prevent-host-death family protein